MPVGTDFIMKTIQPFKITQPLHSKKLDIKKNGQIAKRINARRKAKYFSGRNRLISLESNVHVTRNTFYFTPT